jgi:hypothetical protein
VGLVFNSEIIDTYDGVWSSETNLFDDDDCRAVSSSKR